MIKASQSDAGAFVRAASFELEEGYRDIRSNVSRQLSWDGTGYLAQVTANVVASNTIVVQGREAVEAPDKFIDVGLLVDIVTSGGVIQASAVEISAISGTGTTRTVTLNAAVTVSANSYLIQSGSLNNEIQGLLTQLDGLTTTVFEIDRSLYPSTQGNVVNVGGGQLSLDIMQTAWNLGLNRGGAKYSASYCDFDTQRYYQKLLTADKRYSNTIKGDGGFAQKDKNYLEWNGLPLVADKDCPQRLFFLPEDALKAYVLAELEFADETGTMMIAQTGVDAFEVRIRLFMNLFNEKPSASAVIRNYISP